MFMNLFLAGSAKFRSKGRIPTLTWMNPRNNCTICRSSQPMVGLANNRSSDDEALVLEIQRCSQTDLRLANLEPGDYANPKLSPMNNNSTALYFQDNNTTSIESEVLSQQQQQLVSSCRLPYVIVDARPLLNAKANQAVGKGVESNKNYENVFVLFMDIANIHAARKSMEALEDALLDDNLWLRSY